MKIGVFERRIGAAVVVPQVNISTMEAHLVEISRCVSPGAHAVLVLDGAGWHASRNAAASARSRTAMPASASAGGTAARTQPSAAALSLFVANPGWPCGGQDPPSGGGPRIRRPHPRFRWAPRPGRSEPRGDGRAGRGAAPQPAPKSQSPAPSCCAWSSAVTTWPKPVTSCSSPEATGNTAL
jgi:hypothetical protein